jgi:hypothetical protein
MPSQQLLTIHGEAVDWRLQVGGCAGTQAQSTSVKVIVIVPDNAGAFEESQ